MPLTVAGVAQTGGCLCIWDNGCRELGEGPPLGKASLLQIADCRVLAEVASFKQTTSRGRALRRPSASGLQERAPPLPAQLTRRLCTGDSVCEA